jgi:hypothetical protein
MREFDKLEEADQIRELLRQEVRRPPADVTFAEDTEQMLPELFGDLSVALARSFRLVDPTLVNPGTGPSPCSDWCSESRSSAISPSQGGHVLTRFHSP